jgi:hypothetical protein
LNALSGFAVEQFRIGTHQCFAQNGGMQGAVGLDLFH